MIFPKAPRVIYEKNPLEEVVCQLRFPPILRIDTEIPSAFQERIRSEYPLFEEQDTLNQESAIPPEILKLMGIEAPVHMGKRGYRFASADERWQVVLTREFLALSTRKYRRWEEFKDHLQLPYDALNEIYAPVYFSRIGLRYRDIIRRSKLGLKDVEWSKLLKPVVAGELSSKIAQSIKQVSRNVLIDLDDGLGQVRIRHGLAKVKGTDEQCYVIDADFYTDQKTEVTDARERLDHFNREAGRLFRWYITDQLHAAMEPQPVKT